MQILAIVLLLPATWLGLGAWSANFTLMTTAVREIRDGMNVGFNLFWRIPVNICLAYLVWKMFAWVYPMAWGGGS